MTRKERNGSYGSASLQVPIQSLPLILDPSERDPHSGKQVSGIVFPYQCTAPIVSYCLCKGGSAGLLGPVLLTELQL